MDVSSKFRKIKFIGKKNNQVAVSVPLLKKSLNFLLQITKCIQVYTKQATINPALSFLV
jgi:hypothetical protein